MAKDGQARIGSRRTASCRRADFYLFLCCTAT